MVGRNAARRIAFSAAPYRRSWYGPLLEPLFVVASAVVTAWTYPCSRTARIECHPPMDELQRRLREIDRPIVFVGWHRYELLAMCALRVVPPEFLPTAIGHDGPLSRALQRATAWMGLPVWVYRRQSPVRPSVQIIQLIDTHRGPFALVPDAGGPYLQVKPGLVEIARAAGAVLVPITVRGRRIAKLTRPAHYRLPLPFSALRLHVGDPIDGRTTTVEECQRALEDLELRADALGGERSQP